MIMYNQNVTTPPSYTMASCFNFYSFPGYEFLISTIIFLMSIIQLLISTITFLISKIEFLISTIVFSLVKCHHRLPFKTNC